MTPRFLTALPVLLFAGCASLTKPDAGFTDPDQANIPEAAAVEVRELLAQPYIDPLTRYLERGTALPRQFAGQVRTERDKRCAAIAKIYAGRDATAANLDRLEKAYRYSCPQVVATFARRLAGPPGDGEAADPSTPRAASPTPAPGQATASAPDTIDPKLRSNCYLLFAIRNHREARDACRKPAELGDAKAQHSLAVSSEILEQYPDAVHWARRAAVQALPEAEHHLGSLYRRGLGLPRDATHALKWFERAGNHGFAEAQYAAGLMYHRGDGIARDDKRALAWLAQAARSGHGEAQLLLGELHARGAGTPRDPAAAKKWYLAAAQAGVTEAQRRVGMIYAEGPPAGYAEAYVWLSLAVAGGSRDAAGPRDDMASKLPPQQLADARQRVLRLLEQKR